MRAQYGAKEEVEKVKTTADPIIHVKDILIQRKVDEADLKQIDKEIKETIKQSVEFAENSPEPAASELYTDILKEN